MNEFKNWAGSPTGQLLLSIVFGIIGFYVGWHLS